MPNPQATRKNHRRASYLIKSTSMRNAIFKTVVCVNSQRRVVIFVFCFRNSWSKIVYLITTVSAYVRTNLNFILTNAMFNDPRKSLSNCAENLSCHFVCAYFESFNDEFKIVYQRDLMDIITYQGLFCNHSEIFYWKLRWWGRKLSC